MSSVIIVHYKVKPGFEEHVAHSLARMVEPTRAEPGNLAYNVCRSPRDPAVFAIYEEYVDAAAVTAHASSEYFEHWLKKETLPYLEERRRHDLVAL
ncbi:antibiotic biosynthesis monooxygenase [Frankia sp. CcI49]|uniref:putative quinol monooxygenase n=1 Tax=unclassified Frankia TaxID=2632575 RepID=UPI0006CA4FEF|nr:MULTISPECIES: antibiotic biosynthesis monooxygenase family protein [unclassified Frankia]KPM54036.1 antibiotic biosynthesis monooxygenase [Frankia sp. R43]ONH61454.1 antibiotic biosynthesis monooxygenase [Frankia sp. CcI49]